jgi:hypothetical protein
MLGGAMGLAVIVSAAASRTGNLIAGGMGEVPALNSGYHLAFAIGALCAVAASALALVRLRSAAQVDSVTPKAERAAPIRA